MIYWIWTGFCIFCYAEKTNQYLVELPINMDVPDISVVELNVHHYLFDYQSTSIYILTGDD